MLETLGFLSFMQLLLACRKIGAGRRWPNLWALKYRLSRFAGLTKAREDTLTI